MHPLFKVKNKASWSYSRTTSPDSAHTTMEHGGRCQQTQTRWVRGTLRLLSVTFDAAVIGFSAYFYSKWTIGPLLMLGPPVRLYL